VTRALTAPEKVLLRTESQRAELYFYALKPATIFAARIDQAFTTHDEIASITFDTVTTGAFGDIVPGMTMYIGSAAGLYDLGMVRVRDDATSTVIPIGESSDVDFDNNLYLTVVHEFGIWAKHLRTIQAGEEGNTTSDPIVNIDYNIPYTDQHADLDPVPVLGSIISALWLVGGTVDYTPPTAASSWVLGSSISTYAWTKSAGSVANETTATPTFTFTSAGEYYIACTVTAANGKSTTGYRTIVVFDENNLPITSFSSTSTGSGEGWVSSVNLFNEATLTDVRERSLCMIFSKDYYGATQQSIAAQLGNENILAVGWLDTETINWNPEQGNVSFQIKSANHWLGHLPSFPTGFLNSADAPVSWTEFEDLTVDKAVFHLLHYRTTATSMMDVLLTEDTRLASSLESATGSAWSQMKALSFEATLARPKIDRYGALHLAIDSQMLAEADRAAIPVVLDIETQDWRDTISIPRVTTSKTARVELGGKFFDGTNSTPYFSRASGNIFKQYGDIVTKDRLLLEDQAQANLLSGLVLSNANNEYPKVRIPMFANFRMSDIAPVQYNTLSISADDTERGIVWSAVKIIPRRIVHKYNANTGELRTDIEHEAETLESLSIDHFRPQTPEVNFPPLPTFTVPTWPAFPLNFDFEIPEYIPIEPIDLGDDCPTDAPENGPYDLHISGTQKSNESWPRTGALKCQLRSSAHDDLSIVTIVAVWQRRDAVTHEWISNPADDTWYDVYGIDSTGARVATANKEAITDIFERVFTFDALGSNTEIVGIEIDVAQDASTDFDAGTKTLSATNGATVTDTKVTFNSGVYMNGKKDGASSTHFWSMAWLVDIAPATKQRYDIWYKFTYDALTGAGPLRYDISFIPQGGVSCDSIAYTYGTGLDFELELPSVSNDVKNVDFTCSAGFPSDGVQVNLLITSANGPTITFDGTLEVNMREAAQNQIIYRSREGVTLSNICESGVT